MPSDVEAQASDGNSSDGRALLIFRYVLNFLVSTTFVENAVILFIQAVQQKLTFMVGVLPWVTGAWFITASILAVTTITYVVVVDPCSRV
jgi:hypothetical protein